MTMQGDLALMHANGATFAQVLDAHAHAHLLAEKIRAKFDGSLIDDIREQDANLIDPAASTG